MTEKDKGNKVSPIKERMREVGEKFLNDPEYLLRLKKMDERESIEKAIKKSTDETKRILKEHRYPQEQLLLSFMPTKLTRTSPFFPMSKKNMKDRPYEELEWETSWGVMRIEGKRLSVYDESILLTLLVLVKKHKSHTFKTTQNEICQISNTHTGKNTYKAIWESIKRLTKTSIDLDIIVKKGSERIYVKEMTGQILSYGARATKTGKIEIVINPYFLEMFATSLITTIDLEFRASLKGDIAKALYRFYTSQKDSTYSCNIITLAKAININTDLPLKRIRERIREANRELKNKGFLTKHLINKNDVVNIWKAKQVKKI